MTNPAGPVVKQTPAEGMKIQQQSTNQVGGKITVFDGKSERELGKPADDKPKVEEPAKEDKPKVEEKKPSEEKPAETKLEDGLAALRKSLGFWKDDKKADDKKAEEKKVETKAEEKKTEEKVDEKAEEKPKVTKRAKSGMTPELMETVAQTAARAAVAANKAAEPKTEKVDETADMSESDKRDLEVFQHLEQQKPEAYKGVAKQFVKFTKEFEKYRTKWEEENDGKEFDPESTDHDQFYAKHQPKYDPADLEEAKINMRLEAKLKERERDHEDRYGKLETRLLEQDLAPVIDKKAGDAVAAMVAEVDSDLAKALSEKGPDAIAESDPIAFEVLDRSAADLRGALAELEKLSHPSGRFKFDKKNPIHDSLDRFAVNLEKSIKDLPMDEQIRDGKMFATQTELRSIPEKERSRYWVLTPDDIAASLVSETAGGAKKLIEGERARIKKYAEKMGLSASKPTGDEKKDDAKGADAGNGKPKSPAAATDAGNAAAMKMGEGAGDPAIKTLVNRLFPA